jgi:hypothetical protein
MDEKWVRNFHEVGLEAMYVSDIFQGTKFKNTNICKINFAFFPLGIIELPQTFAFFWNTTLAGESSLHVINAP